MEDKLKAKAQEIRLAMLEGLAAQVVNAKAGGASKDALGEYVEMASILNQLDRQGAVEPRGVGSYLDSPAKLGAEVDDARLRPENLFAAIDRSLKNPEAKDFPHESIMKEILTQTSAS